MTADTPRPFDNGCPCRCCDHGEGSDCGCECHVDGLCSAQGADTPRPSGRAQASAPDRSAKVLRRMLGDYRKAIMAGVQQADDVLRVERDDEGDPLPETALPQAVEELIDAANRALEDDVSFPARLGVLTRLARAVLNVHRSTGAATGDPHAMSDTPRPSDLHRAFNVAVHRAGGPQLPACDGPDCAICAALPRPSGPAELTALVERLRSLRRYPIKGTVADHAEGYVTETRQLVDAEQVDRIAGELLALASPMTADTPRPSGPAELTALVERLRAFTNWCVTPTKPCRTRGGPPLQWCDACAMAEAAERLSTPCASCQAALKLLNPNCAEETLLGAIRNLQQAHLSEKGNAEDAESVIATLRAELARLQAEGQGKG